MRTQFPDHFVTESLRRWLVITKIDCNISLICPLRELGHNKKKVL